MKPVDEILSTIKSLAASPLGSPSTSQSTTALTSLTGYLAIGRYSDSSCKVPLSIQFSALNICFATSDGLYEYVKADSGTVNVAYYTDSLCTIVQEEDDQSYSDVNCNNGVKTYITATSAFTPDISMFNLRLKNL